MAGAELVATWFAGTAVSSFDEHQSLAHRLVAGGYAHYVPADAEPSGESAAGESGDHPQMTVVVPVRDDHVGLSATISSLLQTPHRVVSKVVIVDDGSRTPVVREQFDTTSAEGPRVETVRSSVAAGPAAARNRGLRLVGTPLVAFIDAGVIIEPGSLALLAALTGHRGVVAAAPRITAAACTTAIGRYEQASSPLDMGADPSVVAGDHRVGYVPSACLVCRTAAIHRINGFDQALRFGEDVDLVWRLSDHGLVLYQPAVEATHPSRSNLVDFARQRYSYGTSAGPLSKRHSGRLTPLGMSSWVLTALAAKTVMGTSTWLWVAAGLALRRTGGLAKLMASVGDPWAEATSLVSREVSGQLDGVLNAARRPLSPALVMLAAGGGRMAPPARLILAAAAVRRITKLAAGSRSELVSAATLACIDDLAYSTGVVAGAIRSGTPAPLIPTVRRDADSSSSSNVQARNRSSS